tara:strand:- start:97 stop:612 length:516 start_codon:yes stop_codon:yes gene_type:complete
MRKTFFLPILFLVVACDPPQEMNFVEREDYAKTTCDKIATIHAELYPEGLFNARDLIDANRAVLDESEVAVVLDEPSAVDPSEFRDSIFRKIEKNHYMKVKELKKARKKLGRTILLGEESIVKGDIINQSLEYGICTDLVLHVSTMQYFNARDEEKEKRRRIEREKAREDF